ncbi:MAG: type IV secretory system conjugative DNA transfer family protein [Paracoccaceae bacterium]|nr:type IV secretory system conjugative DNA transfer family protein [Paracoccaceae bacterium]
MSEVADRARLLLAGGAGLALGAAGTAGWSVGAVLDARFPGYAGIGHWAGLGLGAALIGSGSVLLQPALGSRVWRLAPALGMSALGCVFLIGPGSSSGWPLLPPGTPWSTEAGWTVILGHWSYLSPLGKSLVALSGAGFGLAVGGMGWTARLLRDWRKELVPFSGASRAERYRSKEGVLGDAHFIKWESIRAIVAGSNPQCFLVGEDYEPRENPFVYNHDDPSTWWKGGKSELIKMSAKFGSGHALIFAGSGAGKTAAYSIPTCFEAKTNVVMGDPGGTALAITKRAREAMGHTVREIRPGHGINLLRFLEPWLKESSEMFVTVANMLFNGKKIHQSEVGEYFKNEGINVVAALLEHFVTVNDPNPFLSVMRVFTQVQGEFEILIKELAEDYGPDSTIGLTLGGYRKVEEKWFSGFKTTVRQAMDWAAYPELRDMVTVDPANEPDPLAPGTDIFITIPLDQMRSKPNLMRLLYGALAHGMRRAAGVERLMMVDEAHVLGAMMAFEDARDYARKDGLRLALVYQSEGQLQDDYGAGGMKSWLDGVGVRVYSAIENGETLDRVSSLIGDFTVEVAGSNRSTSEKSGGWGTQNINKGTSNNLQKARLMPIDELRALPMDAQIVFFRGQRPLIIGKAYWWRRPEWVKMAPEGANLWGSADGVKT